MEIINDPELFEIRYETCDRVGGFNTLSARDVVNKSRLIRSLFACMGDNVHIEQGLRVDYGIQLCHEGVVASCRRNASTGTVTRKSKNRKELPLDVCYG